MTGGPQPGLLGGWIMIVDNKDRKSSSSRQWTVDRCPACRPSVIGCFLPTAYCPLPTARCPLPTGRPAATLLEVLVSIFIMGIGMLAILVLFPLGALSMAQAIRDDRAAQAASAAAAVANAKDIRRDTAIYNPSASFDVYLNPAPGVLTNADLEKKSYPILVDPIGFNTAAPLPASSNVGGIPAGPNFVLARRSVSFVENAAPADKSKMMYRWFTFQDDIIFDKAGNANSLVAGQIERDVRYSVAYLMQRPRTADPSVVDCWVIVYDGRPLGLSGNLDLAEYAYYSFNAVQSEVSFDPSRNVVTVNYAAFGKPAPPLRAGDWILDVSIVNSDRHAYFCRVAGINDNGTAMEIETQQPLRGFTGFFGPTVAASPVNSARLLFLEGVAHVFERDVGKEP